MDQWERLDLAGRQITELLRYETDPAEINELLAQKNHINMLKRQMNHADRHQPRTNAA